jgi:hypothetical protein
MEISEFLKFFVQTETPFLLLFVSLFFYTVKNSKDREAQLNKIIEERLNNVHNQMSVLIKVWQILLEKELEERK